MDDRLIDTLHYARTEIEEICKLLDEGKLTEKGAFVRMFCLGKVLVGWRDDGSKAEQVQYLLQANDTVEGLIDKAIKVRAS